MANDIERATNWPDAWSTKSGMSAKLGAVSVGRDLTDRSAVSNALAAAVDQEVTGTFTRWPPSSSSDRKLLTGRPLWG